ncbi:conserved Plasmodium protein, unknown function [Plasmodium malariae]|uniref:Uncharacterized protein n=1 Tax=Plasmodium malariae TaxID=5858 RepID=A0A1C3KFK9_PLAMA|nr:conserved Plasmodium protein, unknown function [Plasmodium malariae]
MNSLKKTSKNLLESLSKEDIVKLIRKCYMDKLMYGHVRWKELNRKNFSKQYSVNSFKNIWRFINRNLSAYREEHEVVLKEIEAEAKDITTISSDKKKPKKLNLLFPLNSKASISNISLLRNFTRVNSFFFKSCSNYYSPLNIITTNSPHNSFLNYKNTSMGDKDKSKELEKGVNYIKRNIKDINRRSEFLDYYFLIISLIHQNKKYALLKKMHELYYENKLLKYCNNMNSTYNNYILNIIKKIHEISYVSTKTLNKSMCTKSLEKKFGSSKFVDTKNCILIEIDEQTYQFKKDLIDYKLFYNLFKNNMNLNNNKVLCFFIPLPKKPNHLTFKNATFYYFDQPVYITNNLDEDLYNYIYILHKFFLSFMFWSFYLRYQNIERMKALFVRELEEVYFLFNHINARTGQVFPARRGNNYDKENGKDRQPSNATTTDKKARRLSGGMITTYGHIFEFKIGHIISLCMCVIKMYSKVKRKVDITYLMVIKILNMCIHPILKKKIIRSYLFNIRFIHYVLLKLRWVYKKRKGQIKQLSG